MKNILLIPIGSQAMILPEALAWSEIEFHEVHILTTDQAGAKWNKEKNIWKEWMEVIQFVEDEWNIPLTWSVVEGVPLVGSSKDHQIWSEILLRWAATFYQENHKVYYCLSGGTKTIPASVQQAAKYLGAEDQFHILIYPVPADISGVKQAIQDNQLEYVLLGSESGWPYILEYARTIPFQEVNLPHPPFKAIKQPAKFAVLQYINESQTRVKHAINSKTIPDLPFSSLLMLSTKQLDWLDQPLETGDKAWIESLPKIDLHNHLGGFATAGNLLKKVRAAAKDPASLPPIDPSVYPSDPQWPLPSTNFNLSDYMRAGDNNGSTLLHDLGCLKTHIKLMYAHFLEDNVRYVEVRCSPNNYARKSNSGHNAFEILNTIIDTFDHEMEENEFRCRVKLIIIVSRKQEGDLSDISKHLSLAITSFFNGSAQNSDNSSVVGVDLAGYEFKETRAEYFKHDFNSVHRCGLAVTAHAGENDDAEGIWQAVYKLYSRRIGHGLRLLEAPDLLRSIVERNIGIEMCPYANYQIVGFSPKPHPHDKVYPLLEYLQQGVKVNINTDNIGISNASLSDNYLLLHQLCPGITRMDILKLIKNSIEMGFCGKKIQARLYEEFNASIFQMVQAV